MLVVAFGRLQVTRYKQDGGGPCRTCSGCWDQGSTAASTAGSSGERAAEGSGAVAALAGPRGRSSVQRQWNACEQH